jgi:cell wall-associated NlpC family hydrolase
MALRRYAIRKTKVAEVNVSKVFTGKNAITLRVPVYQLYSISYHTGKYALDVAGFYGDVLNKIWNIALSEGFNKIVDFLRKLSEFQKSPVFRGEVSVTGGIFNIVQRCSSAIKIIVRAVKYAGPAHGLNVASRLSQENAKNIWVKNRHALNYLAPLVGMAVLTLTVYMWSNVTLAVSVNYNGKQIGIVKSEQVFRTALSGVEAKVEEASGESFLLNKSPSFSLSIAKKSDIVNEDTLYDNILLSSGSEVSRAYGLYVNNRLVGSNVDSNGIQAMIDDILLPYKSDSSIIQVAFVEDIAIKTGVFPKSVMRNTDNMKAIITANAANQQNYVAQKGDSPLKVANMFHISVDQLYAQNTTIDQSGGFSQGQTVSVVTSEPTVSVKIIKNEISNQPIPFQVVNNNATDLSKGSSKITVKGQNGIMQVVSQVSYIGGKAVDSQAISSTLLKAPVNQQVMVGTYVYKAVKSAIPLDVGPVQGFASNVLNVANNYTGVRYSFGGTTPNGFDCSGFTSYVFAKNGIYLSRSSNEQAGNGSFVSRSNLRAGDLVFFATSGKRSGISHVGIYVGNNKFIDANSKYGVTYDDIQTSYWSSCYVTARRILN